MQNGHLPGEGGKQVRERVSPAGSGRYPPRLIPASPACPRPPSRLRDPTCPLPNPALPPPGDPRWLCCRQSHPLACSGAAGWGGGVSWLHLRMPAPRKGSRASAGLEGGAQLSCSPLQDPPPGPSEPSPPPTSCGRGLTLKTSPLDGSNTKNRLFMHHIKHTQKGSEF